jgi:hypothetical protein
MKQLIVEYDDSDGEPFIAFDSDDNSFVRINDVRGNPLYANCDVCGIGIISGWEGFDTEDNYCDDHVEIVEEFGDENL